MFFLYQDIKASAFVKSLENAERKNSMSLYLVKNSSELIPRRTWTRPDTISLVINAAMFPRDPVLR